MTVETISDWIQRLTHQPMELTNEGSATEAVVSASAEDLLEAGSTTDEQPATDVGVLASPEAAGSPLLLSVSREAMACEFEVLLNQHQYPDGADVATDGLQLISDLERLFSVYLPRSDLSNLNRFGAERFVGLEYDTLLLLQLAQAVSAWTARAFDITAGELSEVWGFSRRQGRMPEKAAIAAALELVGSDQIELDAAASRARLTKSGVKVNPGGIGKGYALDRAAMKLEQAGISDYMIHGGLSSIRAHGHRRAGQAAGWQVSLKHPWRWEEHLGTIHLVDQALGTSGSGKQFFHFGGRRYSHIIDPRNGWPAQGIMSATVICASAALADSLATALFVMGRETAYEFCERHTEVGAILIYQHEKTGRMVMDARNVANHVWQPLGK